MLTEEIKSLLNNETLPENIQRLTEKLKSLLKMSREKMSKHYARWDLNMQVFRGEMTPDEKDYVSASANEPTKSILPLSYAQVQTFTSFGFLLYTQNSKFFESVATGSEDVNLKEVNESILERDLRKNDHYTKVYQFLLDLARIGTAPLKSWWTVDTRIVDMAVPMSMNSLGLSVGPQIVPTELTSYEGNRFVNVSPYRFFPDTRVPLTRWKEGQFVADEDEWHITNLKDLERRGIVAGSQFVHKLSKEDYERSGRTGLKRIEASFSGNNDDSTDFMFARTEGNVWLNPKEFGLGDSEVPELYIFMLANDRLVRLEKSGYLHGEFLYDVAQFSPDQEAVVNLALSDTINSLQETITFLYNSRISSVQDSLRDRLVVNTNIIDPAQLESRTPIITTKKGAAFTSLDEAVKQLDFDDFTQSHIQDAEILRQAMSIITGVSDNAMGQVASGRRSATENRAANAGAASRMKIICQMAYQAAWASLGNKMLINHRQGVSQETFNKIVGAAHADKYPLFAPGNPALLVGNEDFFTFDATLTSEKGFLAQSLQELILSMISTPELAIASGFQLDVAVQELQFLRGINNAKRFFGGPRPSMVAPTPPAV